MSSLSQQPSCFGLNAPCFQDAYSRITERGSLHLDSPKCRIWHSTMSRRIDLLQLRHLPALIFKLSVVWPLVCPYRDDGVIQYSFLHDSRLLPACVVVFHLLPRHYSHHNFSIRFIIVVPIHPFPGNLQSLGALNLEFVTWCTLLSAFGPQALCDSRCTFFLCPGYKPILETPFS
jgi:hypothetical protein